MDESGLRQLLNADVILGCLLLFPLGRLQGSCVAGGQNDVPWAFASTLRAAALAVPSWHLSIQLLEELPITDVDGFGARQLSADSFSGALLPAQRQSVAGVVGHILQVNLGHAGWHSIKVGALLKGEGARGCLLFPLER